LGVENGALTGANPARLSRLKAVEAGKDFLYADVRTGYLLSCNCHGMDPTQKAAVLGSPMRQFLCELVEGAEE